MRSKILYIYIGNIRQENYVQDVVLGSMWGNNLITGREGKKKVCWNVGHCWHVKAVWCVRRPPGTAPPGMAVTSRSCIEASTLHRLSADGENV